MAFQYPTVEIAQRVFKVLASIDQADAYLAADPNSAPWDAGDATAKAKWLVSATRILGRQSWPGDQSDELAFPRDGGDAIPAAIQHGAIELALALAGGYDAANQQSTASGIKRQKAGSVEQEFFYGAGGGPDGQGLRFPLPVWELIASFLAGAGSIAIGGAISSGTCAPSSFELGFGTMLGPTTDSYDRDYR